MIKLEADIKKKTINTFVGVIELLPSLNMINIKSMATVLCDAIDKEVEKSKREDDVFG